MAWWDACVIIQFTMFPIYAQVRIKNKAWMWIYVFTTKKSN